MANSTIHCPLASGQSILEAILSIHAYGIGVAKNDQFRSVLRSKH